MRLKISLEKKVKWTIVQFQSKAQSSTPAQTIAEYLDFELDGTGNIPRTKWRLHFHMPKNDGGDNIKLSYELMEKCPADWNGWPERKDEMFHSANVRLLQQPISRRVTCRKDPADFLFGRAVYTDFKMDQSSSSVIPIMSRSFGDIKKFICKGDLHFEVSLGIYSRAPPAKVMQDLVQLRASSLWNHYRCTMMRLNSQLEIDVESEYRDFLKKFDESSQNEVQGNANQVASSSSSVSATSQGIVPWTTASMQVQYQHSPSR